MNKGDTMSSVIVPKPTGFARAYASSLALSAQLRPAKVPSTNFEGLYAAIAQYEVRNAGTVRPPRRRTA